MRKIILGCAKEKFLKENDRLAQLAIGRAKTSSQVALSVDKARALEAEIRSTPDKATCFRALKSAALSGDSSAATALILLEKGDYRAIAQHLLA